MHFNAMSAPCSCTTTSTTKAIQTGILRNSIPNIILKFIEFENILLRCKKNDVHIEVIWSHNISKANKVHVGTNPMLQQLLADGCYRREIFNLQNVSLAHLRPFPMHVMAATTRHILSLVLIYSAAPNLAEKREFGTLEGTNRQKPIEETKEGDLTAFKRGEAAAIERVFGD